MTSYDSTWTQLGLAWQPNGQSVLSGPLLRLANRLDDLFLRLAAVWLSEEFRFPTFVCASDLHRLDYFRAFPHLATFPVSLTQTPENIDEFIQGKVMDEKGTLLLTHIEPIKDVLTPAACYPLYIHHQGSHFTAPRYFTVRNTCFRREQWYRPLVRQWAFTMREVVCIGTQEEVRSFLRDAQEQVTQLLTALRIPCQWKIATDPFFRPTQNPKYIMQRVNPVKQEAVYRDELALGSVNLHQDHFGAQFELQRDGSALYSGCVAFGLERWLHALVTEHGSDPKGWPDPDSLMAGPPPRAK
jgi:seryl-tRNA synthetase